MPSWVIGRVWPSGTGCSNGPTVANSITVRDRSLLQSQVVQRL